VNVPRLLFGLLLACGAVPPAVAGNALDSWLTGLQSLRTSFAQTVRDAHGKIVERGRGELIIVRPGRFRWDYRPEGAPATGGQLLVCDGGKLWFFDRELAQVTVRDAASALRDTPVMLLSGSPEQAAKTFDVAPLPARADGVSVVPRTGAGDFARVELHFRGGQLVSMQINDRLGQTATLEFAGSQRNARVDPALLQFTPPAGVDVIGGGAP
jgi:outer membrane lipoprotein carrier protein